MSRAKKIANIVKWILCPICGNKTRLKIRADTELKNFPLFCPKCRQESLISKATAVNPKLTALNVELAQVEDEIEKLLNTLTGTNAVLLSYANGKIEELGQH